MRNCAAIGRGDGALTLMSVAANVVPKPSGPAPVVHVESSKDVLVHAGSGAVAA